MGTMKGTKIGSVVVGTYLLCYVFRVLEYYVLRTDQTWVGEAIVHKIMRIVILLVIYIGLYVMEFAEYRFAILETGLKLIYIIALVLISGLIWDWYNNLPVAVLVLMTIGIFVVCVCLDAISLISEVKSINVLIEGKE